MHITIIGHPALTNIFAKYAVFLGFYRLFSPINVLILDEPTNHFDMISKDVLKNALIDFKGTMIIVSHDREFLQGLTTKTYEFKKGQIKAYMGDINEFLEQQQIDSLDLLEKR